MIGFLRQLKWELYRMFTRRRTHIGFAIFLIFELILFTIWQINAEETKRGITKMAGGLDEYFSALTFAFIVITFTKLFLIVFVCLVAGDIVAKESEDGNLRLLLSRPVSRFQLLFVKFTACQIYTTILFIFVAISAFLIGVLACGWGGGLLFWSPKLPKVLLLDWNEGIIRYFVSVLGFSILFLPVVGIAFFLSCLKIKPATATIVAIAVFLTDLIFSNIPFSFMDPYRKYLFTTHMDAWYLLLYEDVAWARVAESTAWLIGFGLTGFLLGLIAFSRRDIKS